MTKVKESPEITTPTMQGEDQQTRLYSLGCQLQECYDQYALERAIPLLMELKKVSSGSLYAMNKEHVENLLIHSHGRDFRAFWRLTCKMHGIPIIPELWFRYRLNQQHLFGPFDYHIEVADLQGNLIYIEYWQKGNDDPDLVYRAYTWLPSFLFYCKAEGWLEAVSDTCDHTGEHVQKSMTIPERNFMGSERFLPALKEALQKGRLDIVDERYMKEEVTS